jgi:hypothetical protein
LPINPSEFAGKTVAILLLQSISTAVVGAIKFLAEAAGIFIFK